VLEEDTNVNPSDAAAKYMRDVVDVTEPGAKVTPTVVVTEEKYSPTASPTIVQARPAKLAKLNVTDERLD
jgi:hypothetical protein